jgi:hypothetical protein
MNTDKNCFQCIVTTDLADLNENLEAGMSVGKPGAYSEIEIPFE